MSDHQRYAPQEAPIMFRLTNSKSISTASLPHFSSRSHAKSAHNLNAPFPKWIASAGCLCLLALTALTGQVAHAQGSSSEVRTKAYQGNKSVLGGPGYFTTAVGAGFGGGLSNQSTMLDLTAGYNIDYGPQLTGKTLVDMNLGTGSDTSRFIDLAIGANFFPADIQLSQVKPYLGADAGVGFVRTANARTADSLAVAGTVGFQMLTNQTNVDVNLRYELLTQQISGANPQVLGLRIGMNY